MTEPNGIQDEARQRAIRAALAELRAEYAEALPGAISEMQAATDAACASGADTDFRHLRTLAHRMHGASGSYGFKGVSVAACKLEDLLLARETGEPGVTADVVRAALVEIQTTVTREIAEYVASLSES